MQFFFFRFVFTGGNLTSCAARRMLIKFLMGQYRWALHLREIFRAGDWNALSLSLCFTADAPYTYPLLSLVDLGEDLLIRLCVCVRAARQGQDTLVGPAWMKMLARCKIPPGIVNYSAQGPGDIFSLQDFILAHTGTS